MTVATIIKQNSFENGIANGQSLTTGNSGNGSAGDPFDRVDPTTGVVSGSSTTVDTTNYPSGTRSVKWTQAGTGQPYTYYTWTTPYGDWGFRIEFEYSGPPGAQFTLARGYSDNAWAAAKLNFAISTTSKISVQDVATGTQVQSTASLTPGNGTPGNGWYTAIGRYQTATNTFTATVYPHGSGTPVMPAVAVTVATDVTINSARFGIGSSTNTGITVNGKNIAVGHDGDMPRLDLQAPPNAAFTAALVGRQLTVNNSSSTSAGSITAYDIDWGDATAHSSGVTPAAHTYSAAGDYSVVLTVTDNLGQTDTATLLVTVANASSMFNVGPVTLVSGWQLIGAAADPQHALIDADLTDFIRCPTVPDGTTIQYAPFLPITRYAGQPIVAVVLAEQMGGDVVGTVGVGLYEGTTQRSAPQSITPALGTGDTMVSEATPGPDQTLFSVVFPPADVAAITNMNNVRVGLICAGSLTYFRFGFIGGLAPQQSLISVGGAWVTDFNPDIAKAAGNGVGVARGTLILAGAAVSSGGGSSTATGAGNLAGSAVGAGTGAGRASGIAQSVGFGAASASGSGSGTATGIPGLVSEADGTGLGSSVASGAGTPTVRAQGTGAGRGAASGRPKTSSLAIGQGSGEGDASGIRGVVNGDRDITITVAYADGTHLMNHNATDQEYVSVVIGCDQDISGDIIEAMVISPDVDPQWRQVDAWDGTTAKFLTGPGTEYPLVERGVWEVLFHVADTPESLVGTSVWVRVRTIS